MVYPLSFIVSNLFALRGYSDKKRCSGRGGDIASTSITLCCVVGVFFMH